MQFDPQIKIHHISPFPTHFCFQEFDFLCLWVLHPSHVFDLSIVWPCSDLLNVTNKVRPISQNLADQRNRGM